MISFTINVGPSQIGNKETGRSQTSKETVSQFSKEMIKLPTKVKILQWKSNIAEQRDKQRKKQPTNGEIEKPNKQMSSVYDHKPLAENQNKSHILPICIKPQKRKEISGDPDDLLLDFLTSKQSLEEEYLRTWYEKLALQSTLEKMICQRQVNRIVTSSLMPELKNQF